jgi:hypothetical protein
MQLAQDSNYYNAAGTDDSTTLMLMADAAIRDGMKLEIPGGKVSCIRKTVKLPVGLEYCGRYGRLPTGVVMPSPFVWGGPPGLPMFDVAAASKNIPGTPLKNICLIARTDGVDPPGNLLQYRGVDGYDGIVDTGSYLEEVWLQHGKGTGLSLMGGATNFYVSGGRIDDCGEFAFYSKGGSVTFNNNITITMGKRGKGIMDLDGENGFGSMLKLYGVHLESIGPFSTFKQGLYPFDRSGLIRLRVSPTATDVQHYISCDGLELDEPFTDWQGNDVVSHCVFQVVTLGNDPTKWHSNPNAWSRVSINCKSSKGIERQPDNFNPIWQIRPVGGDIPTIKRPANRGTGNYPSFVWP